MEFKINDLVIPQEPLTIKSVQIKLVELKFNEYAKFFIYFFKNLPNFDTDFIKMETVIIQGDEYKAWKDDDNYIINLICQKIGAKVINDSNQNLGPIYFDN